MFKRRTFAVIALTLCITLNGCSNDDSSTDNSSEAKTDTSSVVITVDNLSKLGSRLRPIAEMFAKKHYTVECTLTGSEISEPIRIMRAVNGDEVYQLQTEKLGSHGCVTIGDTHYDFDYVCGIYRESNNSTSLNVIEQIAANGLSVTKPRNVSSEYDVEEYIYTGETYITKLDFYFEKTDGRLVKYVTTYSIEGKDDITETRTIEKLEANVDDKLFNAYFTDELADFENMSEDQRLGFCMGLIGSYGITADEMSQMGVNSANLKNLDYNTLFRLVYTYGKPHEQTPTVPDDSSENESSGETSEADSSESSETDSSDSENSGESSDSEAESEPKQDN